MIFSPSATLGILSHIFPAQWITGNGLSSAMPFSGADYICEL
jgi:hypothetical protein